MKKNNQPNPTYFYQFILNGELDTHWMAWFDGMILTWCEVAQGERAVRQTMLSGPVADQAALHGLLHKIRDLNLELVAVTRIMPPRHVMQWQAQVSPEQIALVQHSFAQLADDTNSLTTLFYARLFALAPTVRTLFHQRQADQERKFGAMLTALVNGLPHLESLTLMVQGLGRRHVTYGVQAEQYALVEHALLWALAQCLGEHFTPAVAVAWQAVYALVVEMMQSV